MTAAGLGALPLFLWNYYYVLDLDYAAKSGALVGSGAVMLLACAAIRRWRVAEERS